MAENDLGLSTEEILSAPDRELNTWASLKKTCIYQSEQQDKADFDEYAKKKNNVELKKKILPSLFASNPEENLVAEQKTKAGKSKNARRRRKRNQLKEAEDKVKKQPKSSQNDKKIAKKEFNKFGKITLISDVKSSQNGIKTLKKHIFL